MAVNQKEITQSRFDIMPLSPIYGVEPVFWFPEPEPVPIKEGWRRIRLSSVPNLPERLKRIQEDKSRAYHSEEEIVRLLEGSVLHQFYAFGRLLQLRGQPETLACHFPTLKRDSPQMVWMVETINKIVPIFTGDNEKGLEALWQEILEKNEQEMREKLPLLIQPDSGLVIDRIFSHWQASNYYSRGFELIRRLSEFAGTPGSETEHQADFLYFETGVLCFIPEVKFILMARFDELASARKKGEKRSTWVIDFKSGQKPREFEDADLAYFTLMTAIAERVTVNYLAKGGIPAESGYVPVTIKNFCARGSIGRVVTLFRYLEGNQRFYIPFLVASVGERERVFGLLQSWSERMKEYKITSI